MSSAQIAATLLFVTGVAHSYLGERYLLQRLFRRDCLPKLFGDTDFTKGTLRFVWHLTTVAWWALAYLLLLSASAPPTADQVQTVIGGACLASALFPAWFTRGRHLSWVVFLACGTLLLTVR